MIQKDKSIKDINTERLDEVNQRVIDWAVSTKEIASLQTLEEYRGNFLLATFHNELKRSIFSIQAYIHTLLEGGLHDEEINMEYLKRALDNTTRLQSIVEDLDIISKLEANQTEMDFRRFDIKELVTEIFRISNPWPRRKHLFGPERRIITIALCACCRLGRHKTSYWTNLGKLDKIRKRRRLHH